MNIQLAFVFRPGSHSICIHRLTTFHLSVTCSTKLASLVEWSLVHHVPKHSITQQIKTSSTCIVRFFTTACDRWGPFRHVVSSERLQESLQLLEQLAVQVIWDLGVRTCVVLMPAVTYIIFAVAAIYIYTHAPYPTYIYIYIYSVACYAADEVTINHAPCRAEKSKGKTTMNNTLHMQISEVWVDHVVMLCMLPLTADKHSPNIKVSSSEPLFFLTVHVPFFSCVITRGYVYIHIMVVSV